MSKVFWLRKSFFTVPIDLLIRIEVMIANKALPSKKFSCRRITFRLCYFASRWASERVASTSLKFRP